MSDGKSGRLQSLDALRGFDMLWIMLLTGGLCSLLLAVFFYLIDVRGLVAWSRPLQVIGQNSIVAYLLPGLVCFFPACPLVAAIGKLTFCWLVLWLLACAKVFVKV